MKIRKAECHPNKKHYAKGLCMSCYNKTPLRVAKDRKAHLKWRLKDLSRYLWNTAKNRAKRNGIAFSISKEDVVIPEICPVLGIPLFPRSDGRYGPTENSPSLDRIVPELGYIKGNVTVISHKANTIKNWGTLAEHRAIVAYLEKLQ